MKKVLFVGGGSIGHIAPAVAVARALKELHPETEAHFICSTRGEDANFLKKEGMSFEEFDAPRLSLSFPWKFLSAYRHAKKILDAKQPDVIFSKGGYVSVPVCSAAKKRGIPIVLHESDVVSGYANRLVSRWAQRVCLGFPKENPSQKEAVTGNPIRPDIVGGSKEEGLRITSFIGDRPVLLVYGGSQGAQALNDVIINHLDALTENCDVIHITGRGKTGAPAQPHYFKMEFAHEELCHLYTISDLAVSRAGASNIGECAANGIPMILVPLRGVGHDHQYKNALYAAKIGGCILLNQERLDDMLVPTVKELFANAAKREGMSRCMAQLHHPEASRQIAEIIFESLASGESHH